MIPQKRTPYSWFYIPRYPHQMQFLMQESSISLQILGRCPQKISHDTLSVPKQPGWSPWKKLKWTKQENTRQKHNKHTNQYWLFVAICFLLFLSHSLISVFFFILFDLFLASLCFWLLFLVLIFASPNVAMATRVTHQWQGTPDPASSDLSNWTPRSAWSRCPTRAAACCFFQKYLDAKSGISWAS